LKPQIFYDTAAWTFNPKQPKGLRNQPFILRPAQAEVLDEVVKSLTEGHDLLIDKSRDEGATELLCKLYALWATIVPESAFLVGSRKEEYVDSSSQIVGNRVVGSTKTLFHKIMYTWATCPVWMRPKLNKSHMHVDILDNGSLIDGEATNENFGAGDRRTGVFLDEFGANDPVTATHIRNRVADVSDSVIYCSTHYYGVGHPYGKLRFSGKVKVVVLPWYRNPNKNAGLYRSPDLNYVEVMDRDYYKTHYPTIEIPVDKFKLSELEVDLFSQGVDTNLKFVADGNAIQLRSPWYDVEESRRDARDMAQNINMSPAGAGDMFFNPQVLQRIRAEHIKKPVVTGEIRYSLHNGKFSQTRLQPISGGHAPFHWWGELKRSRPIQSHNFVVGCDISLGEGQSNSVATVVDTNKQEVVGVYAISTRSPEEFCDDVCAICHWVGGQTHQPYLIWEANGPGGIFDQRRRKYSYNLVYIDTATRSRVEKRTKKPGWYSTRTAKYDLLLELRSSLAEGLRSGPTGTPIKVPDEATIKELEDFIFYDTGEIGLTASLEEVGGAKAAHGDRVIALALAVKGMRYQRPGRGGDETIRYSNILFSAEGRLAEVERKEKEEKRSSPWLTI
jgi:hypothetical protein